MTPYELVLNLALSGLVLGGAWFLARGARGLVRFGARRLPGPPNAEKTVRTSRAARFAGGVARVFLAVAAAFLVAAIWGFDAIVWASSGLGEDLVGAGLHLALLLVGAALAFELAGFAIAQGVKRISQGEADPRRIAQLNTLGPMLTGLAQVAIGVVAGLMALGEIGVEIGPLLAGAGIVGVALGFGAQSVVKDFLTGVFLIAEDIVSVGDIVQIGGFGGQVEKMTLRTIRLRDFDGSLHVFPYGEAQVIHNLTKTFSYYVFDLQVSYGSDIDKALQVMRVVGDDLKADPKFQDMILEPIEVVGVDSLGDNGVALKARIKTRPTQQWTVGREYNRRIKLAFDQEGIDIPYPHMQVVLPDRPAFELVDH